MRPTLLPYAKSCIRAWGLIVDLITPRSGTMWFWFCVSLRFSNRKRDLRQFWYISSIIPWSRFTLFINYFMSSTNYRSSLGECVLNLIWARPRKILNYWHFSWFCSMDWPFRLMRHQTCSLYLWRILTWARCIRMIGIWTYLIFIIVLLFSLPILGIQ